MGNTCQQYFNTPDNELTTGDEDYDPSIRELKMTLIKKICSKNDYLVLKPISNEEFNNQLKNKPAFYRIKNQLKDQLRQINFDSSYYENVSAFKVTNVSTGEIQYYKGSYDISGQCCGEGLWLNNYNIYYGNFLETDKNVVMVLNNFQMGLVIKENFQVDKEKEKVNINFMEVLFMMVV